MKTSFSGKNCAILFVAIAVLALLRTPQAQAQVNYGIDCNTPTGGTSSSVSLPLSLSCSGTSPLAPPQFPTSYSGSGIIRPGSGGEIVMGSDMTWIGYQPEG